MIAGGGLVYLLASGRRWWQWVFVGGFVVLLGIESFAPGEQWSPYYKLSAQERGASAPALYVSANNIPYQAARSLAALKKQKPFYFYPYRHVTASVAGQRPDHRGGDGKRCRGRPVQGAGAPFSMRSRSTRCC